MAARIPQYQRRVAPEVTAAPRVAQASTDASGLARGLSNLANDFDQIHQREVQEAEQTFAISTDAAATNWKNDRFYNPENGAMNQKGGSALGLTDRVMSDWNSYAQNVIGSAKTPQQKLIATRLMSNHGSQIQSQLSPYESQEIKVYKDGESAGGVATAQNDAALNFNDPEVIGRAQERIAGILDLQGERNGWSAEMLGANKQAAISKMHAGVVSQIASSDPLKAQQYMLANAESIAPSDHLKLAGAIRPLIDRQIGLQVGKQALAQTAGPASGLFASMIQAESAGQQFDANGAPLISSKGAVGVAQVMPETGPEAAKAAGLPWDAGRLKTDPAYNKALGQAYFDKLLQDFGGVPTLAVAAYNAGPGMVDDWINGTNKTGKNAAGIKLGDPRNGQVSEADFADGIPFQETRDYVKKTTKAASTPLSFGAIAAQIDAREDLTAVQKDIAISDARERWQWQKDQQEQQYKQTLSSAWDGVVNGGRWQDIDGATWSRLTPQDRKSIMGYNPNRETDPEVYSLARDLIVRGKEVDLLGMRGKLSNGDFKSLADLQIKRQNQGAPATAAMASATTMFSDALRNAGLASSPKPGSKDAKTVALARRYVDDQIQALEVEQGRKATSDQVQQIVDRAFIQGELPGSGSWWNGWQLNEKVRPFQLAPGQRSVVTDIDQVPPSERDKITAALQRAGLTVTDKAILDLLNESLQ